MITRCRAVYDSQRGDAVSTLERPPRWQLFYRGATPTAIRRAGVFDMNLSGMRSGIPRRLLYVVRARGCGPNSEWGVLAMFLAVSLAADVTRRI